MEAEHHKQLAVVLEQGEAPHLEQVPVVMKLVIKQEEAPHNEHFPKNKLHTMSSKFCSACFAASTNMNSPVEVAAGVCAWGRVMPPG
jgi:uncharacterized protein (DUF169 family)